MHNQVLWNIDNELDDRQFERLCTDLLSREGYQDILPVGGQRDHGRDAEIRIYRGVHSHCGTTFFQYSLDGRWERKLHRELRNVKRLGHELEAFVFVTSRSITGEKRDKLRAHVLAEFGWALEIFEREWLRHRLEERHPDLAARHLGVSLPLDRTIAERPMDTPPDPPRETQAAWRQFAEERFEAATAAFSELTELNPHDPSLWKALAWSQYSTYRYRDALGSIRRALALDSGDKESLSIKACILTEEGISTGSRAGILRAKEIFGQLTAADARWVHFYNYGNALEALGEYESARDMLTIAAEMAPDRANVWKNLGTVYFHLHDHKKELRCYDRALKIDPNLPEALCSKAVTLILAYQRFDEARAILQQAIDRDPNIDIRWPRVWYWSALTAHKAGDSESALKSVDAGLDVAPAAEELLNLKTTILAQLWRQNPAYRQAAADHLEHFIGAAGESLGRVVELGRVYAALGDEDRVYEIVARLLGCSSTAIRDYLSMTSQPVASLLEGCLYLEPYQAYRRATSLQELVQQIRAAGIELSENLEEAMRVVTLPTFGRACENFRTSGKRGRKRRASQIFDEIGQLLVPVMTKLVPMLVGQFHTESISTLADDLSRLLVLWPDTCLREISREYGFAGGRFGFSTEDLDRALRGAKAGNLWNALLEGTMLEANAVLHFAPDD